MLATLKPTVYLDTVVANGAMRASRGTVKLTGVAPLHSNSDATDFHVLVERSAEVILWNFRRLLVRGREGKGINRKESRRKEGGEVRKDGNEHNWKGGGEKESPEADH